jgi:predicted SpoU family rRNA methylase
MYIYDGDDFKVDETVDTISRRWIRSFWNRWCKNWNRNMLWFKVSRVF